MIKNYLNLLQWTVTG